MQNELATTLDRTILQSRDALQHAASDPSPAAAAAAAAAASEPRRPVARASKRPRPWWASGHIAVVALAIALFFWSVRMT